MSYSKEVVVRDEAGLHARPAGAVVKVAKLFKADVTLSFNGNVVNAKNLMKILTAGVKGKSTVTLTAEGEDAEQALEALVKAQVELESGDFEDVFELVG